MKKIKTEYDELLEKKAEVLDLIGQFGFVDNENDESPCEIYHKLSGVVIDMTVRTPEEAVSLMASEMYAMGYKDAQREIRKALGIVE